MDSFLLLSAESAKSLTDWITAISTAILALLTVVIAIYAKRAYNESHRASDISRKAYEKSKQEFDENTLFNHKQSAENTIFKLIEFHKTLTKEMKFWVSHDNWVYGTGAFLKIYYELRSQYDFISRQALSIGETESDLHHDTIISNRIKKAFSVIYLRHDQIGNYYKNLYFLLRYIDEKSKKIKHFDKWDYVGILKAQFSKYEILLLPYNCVWIEGDKKETDEFIRLVRDYKLLSAIETDELINTSHKIFFEKIFKI